MKPQSAIVLICAIYRMIDEMELRLGNYCLHNGEIVKIHGMNYHGEIKLNLYADVYKSEDIEPIPLTSEILDKCGFEFNDDLIFYKSEKPFSFFIKVEIFEGSDIFHFYRARSIDYGDCAITYIKYLHQLQNLYYDLTAEELNVQL